MKKWWKWFKDLFISEVKAEVKESKPKMLKCECGSTSITLRVSGVNVCNGCGRVVRSK